MSALGNSSPHPVRLSTGKAYRRVVLKVSGEGFTHPGERGIDMDAVIHIARQVSQAAATGIQLLLVIGGGNILSRGPVHLGQLGISTRLRPITWECWPRL